MSRKPTKESQLYNKFRDHQLMMAEVKDNPAAYEFHRLKRDEAREAYDAHQARLVARKQPPAHITEASRQRWRHYGATGQLSMARICVQMMQGLPTVTDEARELAIEIEQKLDRLIWLMRGRKEQTLPPQFPIK